MKRLTVSPWLRLGLRADALGSLGMGLWLLLFGSRLQAHYAIELWLLLSVGSVCVVYGSALVGLSLRAVVAQRVIACIVFGNALWLLASVWLVIGDVLAASAAGNRFIILQAAAVAGFILLQSYGWRQSLGTEPARTLRAA